MKNRDCAEFLQWCLPRLGLRWAGFRKVRGTVCKRVGRRMRALGLGDVAAYRDWLESHDEEWPRLDALCRIPISRFWRDPEVFGRLTHEVLPALAATARDRGNDRLSIWCAGCASGEEAYSLRLAVSLATESAASSTGLNLVATDIDETLLARARAGLYQRGSLRDMPDRLIERAFRLSDGLYEIQDELRRDLTFLRHDIRSELPDGPFDLISCRNLVFTYFDRPHQAEVLDRLRARLRPGGALVIGACEALPNPGSALLPWDEAGSIYKLSAL